MTCMQATGHTTLINIMRIRFMRSFSFCTETFDSFKTIYGAIAIETVRIAKRNMEKVLNGPVQIL